MPEIAQGPTTRNATNLLKEFSNGLATSPEKILEDLEDESKFKQLPELLKETMIKANLPLDINAPNNNFINCLYKLLPENSGISSMTVRRWFNGETKSIRSRKTIIKLCFALTLNKDSANVFLGKAGFGCLNIRCYEDAIYEYCLDNHLSWDEADKLLKRYADSSPAHDTSSEPIPSDSSVTTEFLINNYSNFKSKNVECYFKDFLLPNKQNFTSISKTALRNYYELKNSLLLTLLKKKINTEKSKTIYSNKLKDALKKYSGSSSLLNTAKNMLLENTNILDMVDFLSKQLSKISDNLDELKSLSDFLTSPNNQTNQVISESQILATWLPILTLDPEIPRYSYIGEWENDMENGFACYKYNNGNIYEGEVKAGKKNGYGIFILHTDDGDEVYKGIWENDVLVTPSSSDTNGILKRYHRKYSNGDRYEGELMDGKRNGTGTYTNYSGETYVGQWKNNLKHGHGILKLSDGTIYEGEWENDLKNGMFLLIYSDGDVDVSFWENDYWNSKIKIEQNTQKKKYSDGSKYIGGIKNNKKNGFGKYIFHMIPGIAFCEKEYIGYWMNDEMHGHGRLCYSNGTIFIGEWYHGIRLGPGKLILPNHAIYEGVWIDNNIIAREGDYTIKVFPDIYTSECKDKGTLVKGTNNGKGTIDYPDGSKYTGGLQNGVKNGKGTMDYPDESKYTGHWQDNMKQGYGTMVYKNGAVYRGYWERNERIGFGKRIYNNQMYEGLWLRDTLVEINNATYTYDPDLSYWGVEKNYKKAGFGIQKFDDKTEYIGEWNDGKRNGYGMLTYQEIRSSNKTSYGESTLGNSVLKEFLYRQFFNKFESNPENYWENDSLRRALILLYYFKYVNEIENNKNKWLAHYGIKDFKEKMDKILDKCQLWELYSANQFDWLVLGAVKYLTDLPENNTQYKGFLSDVKKLNGHVARNKVNGKEKLAYSNGAIYKGELKNNIPNGLGICYLNDGTVYNGYWKDGRPNGKGRCSFPSGDVLEGIFIDGMINGPGKYTYSNYDDGVYEGELKNGQPDGFGQKTLPDKTKYIGEWKDGRPNGKGKVLSNNKIYEGNFINGELVGQEKFIFPQKYIFDGATDFLDEVLALSFDKRHMEKWMHRELLDNYPIIFINRIPFSVFPRNIIEQPDYSIKNIVNYFCYIVQGINQRGLYDVLTIQVKKNDEPNPLSSVLKDLKERKLHNVRIIYNDGIPTNFRETILNEFPETNYIVNPSRLIDDFRNSLIDVNRYGVLSDDLITDINGFLTISPNNKKVFYEYIITKWDTNDLKLKSIFNNLWESLFPLLYLSVRSKYILFNSDKAKSLGKNPMQNLYQEYYNLRDADMPISSFTQLILRLYDRALYNISEYPFPLEDWESIYQEIKDIPDEISTEKLLDSKHLPRTLK
ncbi:MAG: transposase [Lachnospiraceae bacterium]|nr:transposase [Lachnospiraceae bacterium]